jgi:hypothetical protein
MQDSATELLDLGPDGLQLTPGCSPTPGFSRWLAYFAVQSRTHDGFSWVAPRRPVWAQPGRIAVAVDSAHPPAGDMAAGWIDAVAESGQVVEVMYPGHVLGRGSELVRAMDAGVNLAVDVSHVHIQVGTAAIDENVCAACSTTTGCERSMSRPMTAAATGTGR